MRKLGLLPCLLLIAAAPPSVDAKLRQIVQPVSGAQMKRTIEKLVSFGTRHTLSSQTDKKRGIGAAVRWAEAEMKGFGLQTLQTCDTVTKLPRVPTPTKVCNAVAIQRGTERPNDVVIITGHIDSRVSDVMNATADAPGANDDGSGTAAVIEAARVLSKHKFPGTVSRPRSSMPLCRARSRAWSAAGSSPTMPRLRAGKSSPISTTTSSATAAARTGCATTTMSESSPKACAGRAAT